MRKRESNPPGDHPEALFRKFKATNHTEASVVSRDVVTTLTWG
jgi:hypothetical protein